MANRMRIAAAVIALVIASGCRDVVRTIEFPGGDSREWSDEVASFGFTVSGGYDESPLLCVLTIQNRTHRELAFPVPTIMPFAGTTSTNNVRVSSADGQELRIAGVHYDFWERPKISIGPGEAASWPFSLDYHFPGLYTQGDYDVAVRYFAAGTDSESWNGTVQMEPIRVSVRTSPARTWIERWLE